MSKYSKEERKKSVEKELDMINYLIEQHGEYGSLWQLKKSAESIIKELNG